MFPLKNLARKGLKYIHLLLMNGYPQAVLQNEDCICANEACDFQL